jgi:hypothetical protein
MINVNSYEKNIVYYELMLLFQGKKALNIAENLAQGI